jgi:peptide-methionine (S)-S-oxide reductase
MSKLSVWLIASHHLSIINNFFNLYLQLIYFKPITFTSVSLKIVHMKNFLYVLLMLVSFTSCAQQETPLTDKSKKMDLSNYQTAYFASGCFWCVEAVYEMVNGVVEAESGYSGGKVTNPTYEAVCSGKTGHAETVKIYYDSTKVSYYELVEVFFQSHDPTTLNQQGPDFGTQYRSAIFYQSISEKKIASAVIDSLLKNAAFPVITTEISGFEKFYVAEKYHQNFKTCNPTHPYIQKVTNSRLKDFEKNKRFVLKN